MTSQNPISIDLADEAATRRLGEDLALSLRRGDLVALHGDLGMGKSTLARAIIRAIADDDALDVPSPTFTLVQSYALRIPVHHFDLYRLSNSDELEELGLAEARGEGVVLVEWPERAENHLSGAIEVSFAEVGEARRVIIGGPQEAVERIAHALHVRNFLKKAGHDNARRRFMLGDASVRAYEQISTAAGETLILMDTPARDNEPVLRDGLTYSQIAGLAQAVPAFVGVVNALRHNGFAAPQIYSMDLDGGLLLIEHLGEEPFLMPDGSVNHERYVLAAELLAGLHQCSWPQVLPVAEGVDHVVPSYDRAAFEIETELLLDWYLPFVKGREASEAERKTFRELWAPLITRLLSAEQSLVLRDYHSPNLIWREEREGFDRLGIIDVQDAVFGPSAYDVSSLGFDARVDVPAEVERALVEAYCARRQHSSDAAGTSFDRAAFDEAYAITAAHRNTKVLGIFVRLARRDGKTGYLRHLPRMRRYMARALEHPSLSELRQYYEENGFLNEAAE